LIDYRSLLKESAEEEYARFNSKLIPGKEGIIGVRAPTLKKIAKQITKDDWESFLEETPTCFEEEVLKGLVVATAPMDAERRIDYTEGFLGYIDNWATCDSFCQAWKFRKSESDRVYDYFSSLIDSGQEFRMRVSLVLRMSHFMDEEHVGDIMDDIVSYDHDGYYYKMGAAWAASVCYVKFPETTLDRMRNSDMDKWTYNKAIQKICESYRVSDEDKQFLRSIRKK